MFVQHVFHSLRREAKPFVVVLMKSAHFDHARDTPNHQSDRSFYVKFHELSFIMGRVSLCVFYFEGDSALWVKSALVCVCVGEQSNHPPPSRPIWQLPRSVLRIGLKKLCLGQSPTSFALSRSYSPHLGPCPTLW